MDFRSKINTGDWVGSQLKGPHWSPYAQAIADAYPVQIPWFCTLPSNLVEGVTFQDRKTILTPPQQHDVLIFGAYAIARGPNPDNGRYTLLQITHEETGIPWAVPNVVGHIPLGAIAGVDAPEGFPGANRTTVLKLPEAFFLPAHTQLRLDWTQAAIDFGSNLDTLLTFVGVRLIGGKAPKEVAMPDGSIIRVGSRLPWFMTLVMGNSAPFFQGIDWILANDSQDVQFTAPQDCEIEIHDAFFNLKFFTVSEAFLTKLTGMGDTRIWTPQLTPIPAWTGSERDVHPAMPFPKPFVLKPNNRLSVLEQIGVIDLQGRLWCMVTFRGVRLCQY